MKIISIGALIFQLTTAAGAQSQTADDLQIRVGGLVTSANGGEKNEGIWHIILPTIGKPFSAEWSMWGCGAFQLSVGHEGFKEGSTVGWRVEITPRRVADAAVTFRLRWVRGLDNSKEYTSANEDVEVTLRPGEQRLIDRVPVRSGGLRFDGGACLTSDAFLRVSVDRYPSEEFERRLVAADLWLVERLPSGGERSQPLSVRGLPGRPIPFFFDSIADGDVSLELFGQVIARPAQSALDVTLQARSRWGRTAFDWRQGGEWAPQWLEGVIQVKPGEIVELALPKLGERGGPFANRVFSIRIRARQMR